MRIICLAFVILVCSLSPAVGSTENSIVAYGDVPFGISYKKTKSLLSSKFEKVHRTISRDSEDGLRVSYRKGNDFFHFDYSFCNGKLVKCIITAPADFIKNYFNKKYGKATSHYPDSVFCGASLRSQGTYNITNEVWERPKGRAILKYSCEYRSLTQLGVIESK